MGHLNLQRVMGVVLLKLRPPVKLLKLLKQIPLKAQERPIRIQHKENMRIKLKDFMMKTDMSGLNGSRSKVYHYLITWLRLQRVLEEIY